MKKRTSKLITLLEGTHLVTPVRKLDSGKYSYNLTTVYPSKKRKIKGEFKLLGQRLGYRTYQEIL